MIEQNDHQRVSLKELYRLAIPVQGKKGLVSDSKHRLHIIRAGNHSYLRNALGY